MDTAEVLDSAADLLWMYGRCAGRLEDAEGRLCVRGALRMAVAGTARFRDAAIEDLFSVGLKVDIVERVLHDYLVLHPETRPKTMRISGAPVDTCLPWAWNDRLPITEEHDALVIDTLRRCAKELREQ